MQDIDKTKQAIEDGLIVYEDVRKALEDDDKVSLAEGGVLAVKHAGKIIRMIAAIQEIGEELIDLDGDEGSELTKVLTDHFGGDEETEEAIIDIVTGAGYINSGIRFLISKKESKG